MKVLTSKPGIFVLQGIPDIGFQYKNCKDGNCLEDIDHVCNFEENWNVPPFLHRGRNDLNHITVIVHAMQVDAFGDVTITDMNEEYIIFKINTSNTQGSPITRNSFMKSIILKHGEYFVS